VGAYNFCFETHLCARACERVGNSVVVTHDMNPLQTNINLNCIKIRFVRHKEHTASAPRRPSVTAAGADRIGVDCEDRPKQLLLETKTDMCRTCS
jgi:hypothetical protein